MPEDTRSERKAVLSALAAVSGRLEKLVTTTTPPGESVLGYGQAIRELAEAARLLEENLDTIVR